MALAPIMQIVLAVVGAAPDIAKAVEAAKNFIQYLVMAKIVTIEEQGQLHMAVDGLAAARRAGVTSSAWIVAPDPVV
jgi:hypothetical protein